MRLVSGADVALITPLRDGMNLVAKEYVASCLDKGVLILSEFTGAASELNEAILVNPTDTGEVADAISMRFKYAACRTALQVKLYAETPCRV